MLRSSHLPPRYPFKRKTAEHTTHEPSSFSLPKVNESRTRHHRSCSRSSTLEDQPEWLDDLLSDSDTSPRGAHHHQLAGHSVTFCHGLVPKMVLSSSDDDRKLCSEEGFKQQLESECIYGPNSPRRKCNLEFSESSVLLALAEYESHSPMQFIDEIFQDPRTSDFDCKGDCCCTPNELNGESNTKKMHPGQRSRARKLQYIAELEKTVNSFQALESDMAVEYSKLLQHRVVLSMENSKLKQQMARLQQQKSRMDDEYQTLRTEAERLKLGLASALSRKLHRYSAQ